MRIEFITEDGEVIIPPVMEQAAAIWKYFSNTDDVQELVDYLQIAINAERVKEDNYIYEHAGRRRSFDQQIFPVCRR